VGAEILTNLVEFYSLILLVQSPNRNSPLSSISQFQDIAVQLRNVRSY